MTDAPDPLAFAGDTWTGGFVAGMPAGLHRVAVRHGVTLLASERDLLQLRAGEEHPITRPLPEGVSPVRALSVEPRRNPRLAIAGERNVVILDGKRVGRLHIRAPQSPVADVAWGPQPGGGRSLYLMTDEGGLDRARPETASVEEVPLGYLVAMAGGEDGSIAVASIDRESPAVWTTRDGEHWQYRVLEELDGVGGWHLAVAGEAVAISIAWRGVWISRGLDEPLVKCEALGEGGPLVFAGSAADAPLLCAVHPELCEQIVRVTAAGAAECLASIETPPGLEESRVDTLAWDASRGVLWGLMSEGGLLRVEPRRAGGSSMLS